MQFRMKFERKDATAIGAIIQKGRDIVIVNELRWRACETDYIVGRKKRTVHTPDLTCHAPSARTYFTFQ